MKVFIILSIMSILVHAKDYSVDDLIRSALENSKAIKSVEEEQKKVASQESQYWGSALPSLDFSTTYQHAFAQYNPLASSGDMPSFPSLLAGMGIDTATNRGAYALGGILDQAFGSFSNMTKDNTAVISLTLKQPIFAQGKVGIGLRMAKEYKESLQHKLEFVKDTTKASITKSFYNALLIKKNTEIMDSSVKLNEEIFRLAKLRFSIGKTNEIDTIAALMSLQQARIALKEAETAKKVLYLSLIAKGGILENYESFEIKGDFPVTTYNLSYEDALAKFKEKNSVLQQLASGRKVQEQIVKLAKSDHYPLIAAQASIGKLSQFNFDEGLTWYDDRKIALVMNINIFSGFGITEKIKQAKSDMQNFEYASKLTREGLEIALRAAYETMAVNKGKIESTSSLVKMAEKILAIRQKSYDLGAAILTDVQKSEIDLKNAKIAYNAALASYYTSVNDVKLLVGEY